MLLPHQLELLAPAKTAEIAREAILHGADAIYIGGPSFGARHNASNPIEDISALVQFAHRYHSRVFVTLNTILHDSELEPARQQIIQLYEAGVDALIVQDMGVLKLDIPPIQLHASTQCDIRNPEKAKFLSDAGFSQIVLARELGVKHIREISAAVGDTATIEYFIHGALCVAFSGQCNISHAATNRSANRGDCSQACRLPYTLTDHKGQVVAFDKHLLSMKDNDQTDNLALLVDAGVRSFKIEGRYKDAQYVKNITAHYRRHLDDILEQRPDLAPASSGRSEIFFTPNVDKTFHRGHTDYFATERKTDIGAFDSPKYVGLPVGTITRVTDKFFEIQIIDPNDAFSALTNGDGLNYMKKREVVGVQANTVETIDKAAGLFRVFPNEAMSELVGLKAGIGMNRNRDHAWEQILNKKSAERKIGVWLNLAESANGLALTITDADGCTVTINAPMALEAAQNPEKAWSGLIGGLGKLGNTMFYAEDVSLNLSQPWHVAASAINALRREAIEQLEIARVAAWPKQQRKVPVDPPAIYPDETLSFLGNVYNKKAREFYTQHGVKLIAAAYEAHQEAGEVPLMITKHCLRFSFELCPKQAKGVIGVKGQIKAEPMTLSNDKESYTLVFDCKPCEMHVMGKMKPHILKSAPPSIIPLQTITFHKAKAEPEGYSH